MSHFSGGSHLMGKGSQFMWQTWIFPTPCTVAGFCPGMRRHWRAYKLAMHVVPFIYCWHSGLSTDWAIQPPYQFKTVRQPIMLHYEFESTYFNLPVIITHCNKEGPSMAIVDPTIVHESRKSQFIFVWRVQSLYYKYVRIQYIYHRATVYTGIYNVCKRYYSTSLHMYAYEYIHAGPFLRMIKRVRTRC